MTHFTVTLALLRWSGSKTAVSSFGVMKMFWNLIEKVIMQSFDVLNANELYKLKWLIVQYVNFISKEKKEIQMGEGKQIFIRQQHFSFFSND